MTGMINNPKFSVIIPTYKGREYVGEAIQSILDQTYRNFELLVIDDASPDNTAEVIKRFNDARIQYITHERNMGVDRARSTGIKAASGEIIAFLDQDDFFHPEKLQLHAQVYEQQPDVGFSYNARFELNYSARTIRTVWRPSRNITLADLVLWFPIAPSDWVLRREWALVLDDLIGKNQMWTGGEIVYLGNLFMSGCRFVLVNRALNYRRHHSRRIFKNLSGGCGLEITAQERIFDDPRCPQEVQALRNVAHANVYIFWAFRAFVQSETRLGQEFIREAIRHKPSILKGMPCELVNALVDNCSDDDNANYPALLKMVFDQLPREISFLSEQFHWASARGFLLKGARAAIWGHPEDARPFFSRAGEQGAEVDASFLSHLTQGLLDFEVEFGSLAVQTVLNTLLLQLNEVGDSKKLTQLRGLFALNRVFQSYHDGDYDKVPGRFLRAIISDPGNISNRGLWSVLFRSLFTAHKATGKAGASGIYDPNSIQRV